jgi:hypothetical protein
VTISVLVQHPGGYQFWDHWRSLLFGAKLTKPEVTCITQRNRIENWGGETEQESIGKARGRTTLTLPPTAALYPSNLAPVAKRVMRLRFNRHQVRQRGVHCLDH